MLLSTPFKIAYPSISRALILSLNIVRRHINLETYPFHSNTVSCWSQGFEPYHGRAITCAYHYTKLRFLQEYDFTDNHELYWCPVFVSHGLQPMLNDLQREPWPVNHLPAGNVPPVGFEPTYC